MSDMKYATPKHAWVWVCYLHRLAAIRDRERPLVLTAFDASPHTIRLRLFHGRTYMEKYTSDEALKSYTELSQQTTIKFRSPNIEVYRRDDFDCAYTARKSSGFDTSVQKIHAFIASSDTSVIQIPAPGIDEIQAKAISLYIKPISTIRVAIVDPATIVLRK